MANYSRLMDPLVLKSDMATPLTPIWEGMGKLDWKNIFINFILPGLVLLFLAFGLRSKYDQKKQLYQDYFVVDATNNDMIF